MNFEFFNTLRKSDRTEALNNLMSGSYPRRELFLVITLASGIAAIGLIKDDLTLIIGSMIVAPLLMPLLGLGLGIAIGDGKLILTSLRTVLVATVLCILFVIPFAMFVKDPALHHYNSFYSEIEPSMRSSIVAVLAGIISAFAISKQNLNSSMSGVAISVSLIPPLAAIGVAIAAWETDEVLRTAGQYALNVFLIAVFSAAVFAYLKYGESTKEAQRAYKKEERVAKKENAEASNAS